MAFGLFKQFSSDELKDSLLMIGWQRSLFAHQFM